MEHIKSSNSQLSKSNEIYKLSSIERENSNCITVIAIGDPHFKVSNVPESNQMTQRLIELANKIQPDFIVNLGDTLHRHETIHVSPLMRAENMMKKLSKISKTYLIIGNHDRPNNSNYLTDEHPFNSLKEWNNIEVVDKVKEIILNGQKFIFVPYVPPGKFEEALSTLNSSFLDARCIFAHQEFKNAKMGAIVSTVGDIWPKSNPLVVSGHIHDYDKLQTNLIYTGTPMQHAFGDRSDKTISVYKFYPEGNWKEERVDLGLIKREIIYLSPSDIHSFLPKQDRLLKIVIKGEDSEIKSVMKLQKIKELKKAGIKISYKPIINDQQQDNNFDNLKMLKMSYLDRLYHEISHDNLQKIWFSKIFGDSNTHSNLHSNNSLKTLKTQNIKLNII